MLGRPASKILMKFQSKPVTPLVRELWGCFLDTAMQWVEISAANAKSQWCFSRTQTVCLPVCEVAQRLTTDTQPLSAAASPNAEVDLKIGVEMKPFVRMDGAGMARTSSARWLGTQRSWAGALDSPEVCQRTGHTACQDTQKPPIHCPVGSGSLRGLQRATRSARQNTAPPLGRLVAVRSPCMARMASRESDSPSPSPSPGALVEKKG